MIRHIIRYSTRYSALLLVWALALSSSLAGAHDGGATYPRLATYTYGVDRMSGAARDSLARYDLLVCTERPEVVRDLRARNPQIRLAWAAEPIFAAPVDWHTFPSGDRAWSLRREWEAACAENGWYLRDTQGRVLDMGAEGLMVNWTRYCPLGVVGAARGLRASQYYVQMLKRICVSGSYWWPWTWDDFTTYNAVMIEVLPDCICGYAPAGIERADPDRDGIAEGCPTRACRTPQYAPLTILMKAENAIFWRRLRELCPDLVVLASGGFSYTGPTWRGKVDGQKLEMFLRDGRDWRAWWYGGAEQAGYAWCERTLPRGWDRTIVPTYLTGYDDARRTRLGVATALLGDGYAMLTRDQHRPAWAPEMSIRLGVPVGPLRQWIYGTDTLWTRTFRDPATGKRGHVLVNPNLRWIAGVPPWDARIYP